VDKVGKIFLMESGFSRCLVCDCLFTLAASRVHSLETCFPAPCAFACLPIHYAVAEGTA
jgi:hypothetical protein